MENLYITKPPPDVGWEDRGGRLEEGGKGASHWGKEEEGRYVRLGHLVIFISSSGRKKSPYEGWELHADMVPSSSGVFLVG